MLAQELTQLGQNSAYTTGEDAVPLTYGNGQDTALLRSIALQNIGPNEAEEENDLHEKISAQVSVIKLIDDIELNGYLPIDYEVTIDLNGHALKMADNASGSVIKITNTGDLTIIDSNPKAEHKFKDDGTGLWVLDTNGDKTVYGGIITGGTGTTGTATKNGAFGGGVFVDSGGRFTMEGGNIVGCTATSANHDASGGGVYVYLNGQFTMRGGNIVGCTAVTQSEGAYGGGVCVGDTGTFKMSGGSITDCTAAAQNTGVVAWGGGIYDRGTLNISGDVTISGCTADGNTDAMFTYDGTITGGTFNGTVGNGGTISGGTFNGTVTNGGTITGGTFYGAVTNNYGTIDGITVTYQADGKDYATQILQSGSPATQPTTNPTNSANTAFLGWDKADGTSYDFTQPVTEDLTLTARFAAVTKEVDTKEALVQALADDTVDVIKLKNNDIAIDATLIVDRPVTLDLVGYMLEMKGSGSVIKITNTGHLTLVDSDLTSTYYFTPDATGLWKWGTSGTKTVHGGVIYGGNAECGGGVLIEDGGKLTMNGGSIVGCKANNDGGGVKVKGDETSGIFEMNGGTITGCVAGHGGGVGTDYTDESTYGQFTMNGGVIDSCVATGSAGGGGVYASAPFVMNGGTIQNCTTKASLSPAERMGGVFLVYGPHILNGTIDAGNATDGKYIFVNNCDVTIGENANLHANMFSDGGTIALADGVTSATVYGKITNDNYGGVSCYAEGLVTVTYQVNGADYAAQILRSGSPATQPTAPAKTGYDFTGWFTSDGAAYSFGTAVTESLTLTGYLSLHVIDENTLIDALSGSAEVIRLTDDIDISTTLSIVRSLTLDLNGHVLDLKKDAIRVAGGNQKGSMTIMDSDPNVPHKFTPNDEGLWVWDKGAGTGTETVLGGVITCSDSSSSSAISAGGGSTVTMNGGSIVGCTAKDGGDAICLRGGRMNANGGTVDGTVVLESSGTIQGGGSTFTGLIINNNPQAQFSGAHSPLGIVGEKPTGVSGHTYCTVTFDPADSTMERTTRYFLQGKNISSEIRPAPPHGLHLRRLVQG